MSAGPGGGNPAPDERRHPAQRLASSQPPRRSLQTASRNVRAPPSSPAPAAWPWFVGTHSPKETDGPCEAVPGRPHSSGGARISVGPAGPLEVAPTSRRASGAGRVHLRLRGKPAGGTPGPVFFCMICFFFLVSGPLHGGRRTGPVTTRPPGERRASGAGAPPRSQRHGMAASKLGSASHDVRTVPAGCS